MTKKKLSIFIVAETFPPEVNGAARFGQRLAEGLSKKGHDVSVIAPCSTKGTSHTTTNHGYTEFRLKSHSVITHTTFRVCFPWQVKRLIKQIFEEKSPDIVHVQCHFSLGRLAIKEAKIRKIPVVATIHVMPDNIAPFLPLPQNMKKWFIRYLCRDTEKVLSNVDVITAPTQLAIQHLSKNVTIEGIIAVSNGIDPGLYELREHEVSMKNDNPTVLFVGRLAQEKNIDVLIKAIAKLSASMKITLEIIGEGELHDELRQLASLSWATITSPLKVGFGHD
ncbi:hypothetical protein TUM19329_24140 [Legionella antarctica]|uniref:Glycosyltransferase n=1 Tax=Legionella antarctica TaxID=2708020 RepID=A0A6F8T761_9GAMM|nr:glycosyltransferase [Legionella antarctica]BCA96053.1 hypothetical protein TUM19329_24140 [Legionella antarctica]